MMKKGDDNMMVKQGTEVDDNGRGYWRAEAFDHFKRPSTLGSLDDDNMMKIKLFF